MVDFDKGQWKPEKQKATCENVEEEPEETEVEDVEIEVVTEPNFEIDYIEPEDELEYDHFDPDGQWSNWTKYTPEYSNKTWTCGSCFKKRERKCDSPYPVGIGMQCKDEGSETIECENIDCPGIYLFHSLQPSNHVLVFFGIEYVHTNYAELILF